MTRMRFNLSRRQQQEKHLRLSVVQSMTALLPVRGLDWGNAKTEDFVQSRVAKKLENTPVENICTPDPAVAGPALESSEVYRT